MAEDKKKKRSLVLLPNHGAKCKDALQELLLNNVDTVFDSTLWNHNEDLQVEYTQKLFSNEYTCVYIVPNDGTLEKVKKLSATQFLASL